MAMGVFVSLAAGNSCLTETALIVFQVIFTALFVIYVAVFTYLADWSVHSSNRSYIGTFLQVLSVMASSLHLRSLGRV